MALLRRYSAVRREAVDEGIEHALVVRGASIVTRAISVAPPVRRYQRSGGHEGRKARKSQR